MVVVIGQRSPKNKILSCNYCKWSNIQPRPDWCTREHNGCGRSAGINDNRFFEEAARNP